MFPDKIFQLGKDACAAWLADYAPSMGAALAYYTLFSIAPLLLIVIAAAGILFGQDAAHGAIVGQLKGLLGDQGAAAVEGLLKSASSPKGGAISTIVSVVTLAVGATTVFGELQDDLNRIWRAPAKQGTSGLWSLVRARLLSFGMVLTIGFLLVVSLVASAAIAGVAKYWSPWFSSWELLLHVLNVVVDLCLATVFFAIIYKMMPLLSIRWRDVWLGAAVTAALFSIGKLLIGLYLGKASVASSFGAAGSLIVILLWTYYAAQIFLLGAEFASAYAHRYGSLQNREKNAVPPIPERAPSERRSVAKADFSGRPRETLPRGARALSTFATLGVAVAAAVRLLRRGGAK